MDPRGPGHSRTLPKNFTFPSLGGEPPKTPEHPSSEPQLPPPPRHSSVRMSRSGLPSNLFTSTEEKPNIFSICAADIPLPSIEFPTGSNVPEYQHSEITTMSDAFLQPPVNLHRILKTPPAQIRKPHPDSGEVAASISDDRMEIGLELQRPDSACSGISDSSNSSIETFRTHPSVGGSCTSPESDTYDPFIHRPSELSKIGLKSSEARGKSLDSPGRDKWTIEMDNHLWSTYQLYLQDPTITPFKMHPGSLPPLGVSHRVAREAKKTWPRAKAIAQRFRRQVIGRMSESEVSARAIHQGSLAIDTRSGETTPTGRRQELPQPRWPRSEAATRKRLKSLCKRKFSIAPHYQRLLQSRSPSPFLDAFSIAPRPAPRLRISRGSSPVSFATRELGVSLVASSFHGTLLHPAAVGDRMEQGSSADERFSHSQPNQPVVMSVLDELEPMGPVTRLQSDPICRLGSPFMYRTWGPDTSQRNLRPTTPVNRYDTIHVVGPRLRSPTHVDGDFNNHKRRASSNLDPSPNNIEAQGSIQDVIRANNVKDGQRRLRVRSRGNTTSGFSSKDRLEQLFSPTSPLNASEQCDSLPPTAGPSNFLRPPMETIRRLGSPFKLEENKRLGTAPRIARHAPSLSEPFLNSSSPIFAPMAHQHCQKREQLPTQSLPYDPTEPGISDAERIRRQILNLPFSKNQQKAL